MHVRKPVVALIAVAALALALAGCTAETPNTTRVDASSCGSAFETPTPLLDTLTVTGEAGAQPTVDLPNPLQIPRTERQLVVTGEGTPITDTTQLADITVWGGTSTSGGIIGPLGAPEGKTDRVDSWGQVLPGLPHELLCVPSGSRVIVSLPREDLAPDFASYYELAEGQGAIFVVDVGQVVPTAASGSDVFNADHGLPAVIRDTTGRPGLVIPSGNAPTEVRTQTLLKGDGVAVTADSPIFYQLLGVAWRGNKPFANTWAQSQPAAMPVSQAFPEVVAQALEGATVGSQVMVVVPAGAIPAEMLQGSTIPADDALVFVIDVLAVAE